MLTIFTTTKDFIGEFDIIQKYKTNFFSDKENPMKYINELLSYYYRPFENRQNTNLAVRCKKDEDVIEEPTLEDLEDEDLDDNTPQSTEDETEKETVETLIATGSLLGSLEEFQIQKKSLLSIS